MPDDFAQNRDEFLKQYSNQNDLMRSLRRGAQTAYILLVEDNPADAALFKELLECVQDFKFTSQHVRTLKAALDATDQEEFDCIILDLNLPDSLGLDTFKIMREHAPSIAIVMLTGQSDRDLIMRALREGADNYLIKGSCDGNRIAIAILSAMRNYAENKTVVYEAQSGEREKA